jgi:transposase InsO family protein
MNAHLERFNRTIQEEFIDYHSFLLLNPHDFNRKLIDYLIWYNIERVHCALQNKLSPIQFMMTIQPRSLPIRLPMESKIGLHYTLD